MIRFFVRRLLEMVPLLFLLSLLIFGLFQLIPGDYLSEMELNPSISRQTIEDLRRDYGLNKPFYIQYFLWLRELFRGNLAAIIHKFGVSVDFLRKFRAESVFRCDYKASKLVEPNRDEARAPSGNSSARRGLYICVGAGSQGTVRWDTDGASVMRRAFVRDKTMPGAPRCDEKFPDSGHRF